ncbi:MAG: DUF3892 domain-containing protein [Stenomitos rutilans HA7619-LM2]|jgi:hypothetical protein|nr:DUF3892 domain-containing protein [Stenomitos rutilans HA7619-LM2]
MASKHEIICVNKSDRPNPHERITHVGGKDTNGSRWLLTQQTAIQKIESGTSAFFVRKAGHVVDVIVAVSRYGNKYLKTVPDGEQPNNLLSLTECRL